PVQSFVSQARRTRDFWAGSFLLSWLSAVAIKAVTHQGGTIIFPLADDNYLAFLEGKGENGKAPQQGSIPNRFKAEITDFENFKPEQVTEAIQEAWKALSEYIWDKDIYAVFGDDPTLEKPGKIWDRQVPDFWDMSWVITDDIKDSSALDRRKNRRTYFTPDEPGVKCSMMNGWQELSGSARPDRSEMNKFWDKLREQGKKGIKSDLSEKEALCAIAYIKRRFSRYFKDFKHEMKQGWTLKGWDVPSGVPSVSYMAAVHWLEKTMDSNNPVDAELLTNFSKEAKKLTGEYGEWTTEIKCLKDKGNKYYKSLDGAVFYQNNLENSLRFPDDDNKKQAETVLKLLKQINQTENLESISPFYAVLMMDGDSLGKNMSDITKQDVITKGLADFTQNVPDIVYENNGFLIYAGGDDVLAILPLEDAIPCATALRTHYNQCFKNSDLQTSLSGAIEFVHVKTPLTKILKDAHQLLDDIAKEKTGRDALAIRVWKPGGLQLQWAQPWEIALLDTSDGSKKTYLEELVEIFKNNDQEDEQFSSKFLYKIRERFDLLNPVNIETPRVLNDDQAISLMAMEYLNSGKNKHSKIKDTEERVKKAKDVIYPLLKQCRPVTRDLDKNPEQWQRSPSLEVDAALLVRFLTHKGIER
ncbi:MAG: type III-B CRISPR-associated protein Cas10/Cmr2, partial [Thiotrichaceae bacterium]